MECVILSKAPDIVSRLLHRGKCLIPICVQEITGDVSQERGELRPPHPHAAMRLSVALRRRPAKCGAAAASAERSASRACARGRNPGGAEERPVAQTESGWK